MCIWMRDIVSHQGKAALKASRMPLRKKLHCNSVAFANALSIDAYSCLIAGVFVTQCHSHTASLLVFIMFYIWFYYVFCYINVADVRM